MRIRKGIDPAELTVSRPRRVKQHADRSADVLVTAFFNYLEATAPDVIVVSRVQHRPRCDAGEHGVLGRAGRHRRVHRKAQATAPSRDPPRQMDKTDEGLNRAVLDSVYTPDRRKLEPARMRTGAAKARDQKAGDPAKPKRRRSGQSNQAGSQARCNVKRRELARAVSSDEARRAKHEPSNDLPKSGPIYPLVVVLIVNVLIFAAVAYPRSAKVAAADRTAQARRLAMSRGANSIRRKHRTGKAAADAELKKFYGEVLPPDERRAPNHLLRSRSWRRRRTSTRTGVSEVTQERDSSLGKLSTEITLSGRRHTGVS